MSSKTYDPITPHRVAFLGLGVMGFPMAGHLARAGHHVAIYNRTTKKAERWADEYGGRIAATPREAAEGAQIVFSCVGNDDDLRSVMLGDTGALAGMTRDAIVVDNTTASADVARELHAAARARELHFIDAPVSGGQAGAVNGQLTVMCGGDAEPFVRAQPVAMAYARAVTLIGPSGSGQLAKMVNQITIVGQPRRRMKHYAGHVVGVARLGWLEHPVDDAAVEMHVLVQAGAEAMNEGHRPAARRLTTAGTVFAQAAFHRVEENAQHRPLQVGILLLEVAQALGYRQHHLPHRQRRKHVIDQMRCRLDHAPRVTGGAHAAPRTGIGDEKFVLAGITPGRRFRQGIAVPLQPYRPSVRGRRNSGAM